jgi:hypothetical protein
MPVANRTFSTLGVRKIDAWLRCAPSTSTKIWITVVLLVVSAVFLFDRLDHYALWDDEALVALSAKGVLRTGDTSAVVDHNVVAYRDGILLKNLHDRSTPPLPAYLTAASFAFFGERAWAARFPFALFALACVILIVRWLWRAQASLLLWMLMGMAVIGNVSFFLFSRQCRYYAVAIAMSVAIAYLYIHWDGRRRTLAGIALLSIALFASNYLIYVALYVCLAADYLIWGRHGRRLKPGDWLVLVLPQILVCGAIFAVWNPLQTGNAAGYSLTGIADRTKLIWWNLRDANVCEFGVGLFWMAAPFLYFLRRDIWLLRAWLALIVYVVCISLLSPQVLTPTSAIADVRYLVPIIPLSMAIGVLVIRALCVGKHLWAALPLGLIAFGTNWLHGAGALNAAVPIGPRSTLVHYAGELASPPTDPFTVTARWINEHIPSGKTVWVRPDYQQYPLMFHAPKVIYAWQLSVPAAPQFRELEDIHFDGRVPMDYIIVFGPAVEDVRASLLEWRRTAGVEYEPIGTINHFWIDRYRPELFWRRFISYTDFDPESEAIYVFKRKEETGP